MTTGRTFRAARRLGRVAALLWCASALIGCGRKPGPDQRSASPSHPKQLIVPEHGAYTGAYIDFGEREDDVTLEAIEGFEEAVGKHQAIVAFSSYWGEDHFPTVDANIVEQHHSMPLIFWSPWDWPYREGAEDEVHKPDRFSLDNVLAGKSDAYIDRWADGAKAFGAPMFVSLCNEANGSWFPWSAIFYGGGIPVAGSNPPRYTGPEYFKLVYRYIVDRVRARGATNILWVLQLNNYSDPFESWNAMAQFYPGDDYVDWLGLSVYGMMDPDDPILASARSILVKALSVYGMTDPDEPKWEVFENMMVSPYEEICRLSPTKPVMVAEWAVGEFPAKGDKAAWITDGFQQMQTQFPRLHAAIYWHERWQNNRTMLYSDLRINSSPAALEAYKKEVAAPFWLGTPLYK